MRCREGLVKVRRRITKQALMHTQELTHEHKHQSKADHIHIEAKPYLKPPLATPHMTPHSITAHAYQLLQSAHHIALIRPVLFVRLGKRHKLGLARIRKEEPSYGL